MLSTPLCCRVRTFSSTFSGVSMSCDGDDPSSQSAGVCGFSRCSINVRNKPQTRCFTTLKVIFFSVYLCSRQKIPVLPAVRYTETITTLPIPMGWQAVSVLPWRDATLHPAVVSFGNYFLTEQNSTKYLPMLCQNLYQMLTSCL